LSKRIQDTPLPLFETRALDLTRLCQEAALSCEGANFSAASFAMRADTGQPISVRVESRSDSGFGDNAIVWSVDTARSPAGG
jgi:hypothetical protein